MHKDNWDDLRFVLAVADTGSVSAAARSLRVNHATVLRRIASFEDAHDGPVFVRGAQGYEVMPERLAVIEAARMAASALAQVSSLMRGGGTEMRPIRVTSTDTMCTAVLPEILARLNARGDFPRIDLVCTNAHRNLGRLEADITVRPAAILPADLVGLQSATLGFGAYAAADRTVPASDWLGLTGTLASSAPGSWLSGLPRATRTVASADSFVVLAEMAASGLGRAVLPCILGERHPGLARLNQYGEIAAVPLWVASHSELNGAHRLAQVRQALAEGLIELAAPLRGPAGVSTQPAPVGR